MDPATIAAVTATLALAIKVIGLVVAVLGSCTAVPAATRRLLRRVRSAVVEFVRTKILRRRAIGEVMAIGPASTADIAGRVTFKLSRARGSTVEERIAVLETEVQDLDRRISRVADDLHTETDERKRTTTELARKLEHEVARLDEILREQVRATEEVDARALPILLVGLVLSTFSGEFASIWGLAIAAALVGIGTAVYAVYLLAIHKEPPQVRASHP